MTTCLQRKGPLPQGSTGRRRYCSDACRVAAMRARQVAVAFVEARGIATAFLRLGREARPELAWRCEGVGKALAEALHRYFGELEG